MRDSSQIAEKGTTEWYLTFEPIRMQLHGDSKSRAALRAFGLREQ